MTMSVVEIAANIPPLTSHMWLLARVNGAIIRMPLLADTPSAMLPLLRFATSGVHSITSAELQF